jgi:hypothetical protein
MATQADDVEDALTAAADLIASTLAQPTDSRAWDQLLIYCPREALERRLERIIQQKTKT